MSLSILDVLLNAQVNFGNVVRFNPIVAKDPMFRIAMDQLTNGIDALENGQSPDDTYTDPVRPVPHD